MSKEKLKPQPFSVIREYLKAKSWVYSRTKRNVEVWEKESEYMLFPTDQPEMPGFEVARLLKKTNGTEDEFQFYSPL